MDISKFSWAEAFSNNNGKTSSSTIGGLFLVLVSGITFVFGCFTKNADVINNSTMVIGLGSTLLLGKKIVDGRQPLVNSEPETVEEENNEEPAK